MIHTHETASELARPHFEAVLTDIARMYGLEILALRGAIKRNMIIKGLIKKSTTELSDEALKNYANKMTAFYLQQAELEPSERIPVIIIPAGLPMNSRAK